MVVSSGGGGLSSYLVKEDGLQFQHSPTAAADPSTTPDEYLSHFRQNFEMNILEQPDEHTLVLELLHCDVSFVNALRRILLAEVSTVAIEKIYLFENSSLIHDEVLSHRLGLIPLQIDARLLEEIDPNDPDFQPTDQDTVVFKLHVECTAAEAREHRQKKKNEDEDASNKPTTTTAMEDDDDDPVVVSHPEYEQAAAAASSSQSPSNNNASRNLPKRTPGSSSQKKKKPPGYRYPSDRPYTKHVYSSDLQWVPQTNQEKLFGENNGVRPVHEDILIAKLRPGQVISLEAHGHRGIGKDHAKFSPVATASYRLCPQIELIQPVYDDAAQELVHVYEPGVFALVDTDPDDDDPPGTTVKAQVVNPYACTMSRNYMKHPQLAQAIRMTRIPDHFIFSIESVGAYRPGVLLAEALRVLQGKCQNLMDLIDQSSTAEASS